MAGLLSLCFFNLNKWWRLGIGIALIAMHNSFLFDPLYLHYINNVDFGGVLGIFSWCGYLLLTSFLAEQYFTGKKDFYITVAAAAAAATVFALVFVLTNGSGGDAELFFTLSKVKATIGYIFVSFGVASVLFALCDFLTDSKQVRFVTTWGQSTIVFFIYASAIAEGLSALLNSRHDTAGFVELFIYCAIVFVLMALPAWMFNKMKLKVAA